MKAAILAGGMGTRIGSLYPELPKPMIPVCGKPLLQRQIESLAEQGIEDIILMLGYKADIIKQHFGEGKIFNANISYITEDKPLGTGGALSLLPKEDTLILYGDVFVDVDFKRFTGFHKRKSAAVTLLAHPNSHPYDSDIIVTDTQDCITAWKSKKDKNRGELRNIVNAGLYIFSADTLRNNIRAETTPLKRDLEHDIILPMLPEGKIYAYRSTEYVKDMGTPERLREVEKAVTSGITTQRNLKNKQKAVFIDRDGTINIHRGLISSPKQIELIPEAAKAVKKLNNSGYLAICITNQPVIARGMATHEELDAIHARLDTLLGQEGAYLDDLFYCPHHPDKGYPEEVPEYKIECDCRKPKPGLLLKAAQRYNIDLEQSFMIGDTTSDIAAGTKAGCKTIGVKTGRNLSDGRSPEKPDIICKNISEAVEAILSENLKT